jgi:hypothetical protein
VHSAFLILSVLFALLVLSWRSSGAEKVNGASGTKWGLDFVVLYYHIVVLISPRASLDGVLAKLLRQNSIPHQWSSVLP